MKLSILLITFFFSLTAFSQYDGEGEDEASRFRPGGGWFYTGIRPGKTDRPRKYDRLIFDILYNDWAGDLKPFQVKPTSIGFGVNLMFDVPLPKKNTVSFGWGFNYNRTRIQHNNTLFTNIKDGWTKYVESPVDVKTSLNYNQFSIPLEIRFRKESWKHLKVHLGGKIGYLTNMNEKTRLKDESGKTKIKDYHFPDVNNLQYSAHIRFGLRNYALFGEYNFAPLFSNSMSTQINVLRLGLSISLF
ncbi:MAG: outer membrane beta-barrel protein [Bacteroidota bacterium]